MWGRNAAHALKGLGRLVQLTDGQAEVRHVQRGGDIARLGIGDLACCGERLVVLAERAIHVDQRDGGGRCAGRTLRRLREGGHGVALLATGVGRVPQVGQGQLVVRLELQRLSERLGRLLIAALGGQRVAQVTPAGRVVGPQLGDLAQLLDGVLRAHLHAGLSGEAEQLDVLGPRGEFRHRGVSRLPVLARFEARPGLLQSRHLSPRSAGCPIGGIFVHAQRQSQLPLGMAWRREVLRPLTSCAWIAVITTVLTMSCTRQPRLRSLTGWLRPCSTGPMATAPEERCTAL